MIQQNGVQNFATNSQV